MNTLRILCFTISAVCMLAFNNATSTSKGEQKLVIRGRVTFPKGSKAPIESGAIVAVELQDTSLADAPAKVIAKGTNKATRFPIAFAIQYSLSQITQGNSYSLSVSIRNKKNELLYVNDVHITIIPTGTKRTKFINVPVILVKKDTTTVKKSEWPELVGRKGEDAVRIIKKETGFTNVVTILEGSAITLDFSWSRVRITVNSKGIVTMTPTIA
ncbi:hypothetical protein I4U23_030493 [Adineta vaga]|nr:hypothetical protein I4U23_030493 [Adineta vaga]